MPAAAAAKVSKRRAARGRADDIDNLSAHLMHCDAALAGPASAPSIHLARSLACSIALSDTRRLNAMELITGTKRKFAENTSTF